MARTWADRGLPSAWWKVTFGEEELIVLAFAAVGSQLAELEDISRKNRIKERLEAARRHFEQKESE